MKNKLKTKKMKTIDKYRKSKNMNKYKKPNKIKNKKSMKKYKKSRKIIRKKIMKGGENFNLSVDEARFDIILRTNEKDIKGTIERSRFLIVTDKLTGKQYIIDASDNDAFNLFIVEPDRYNNSLNDKIYVYHIDYNDTQFPINPVRTPEYIERQMYLINNEEMDLYEKLDELTEIGLNFVINLSGYDYNEVKTDYIVNIDGAILRLNELNRMLQSKCPSLEVRLNYFINQPGILSTFYTENLLTLCLYNQGNCIASIMCKLENYPLFGMTDEDFERERPIPNSFEISSETNISVQGRKFNKLLRAVLIIISNQITVTKNPQIRLEPLEDVPPPPPSQSLLLPRLPPPPTMPISSAMRGPAIQHILSQAINPISAWLSINYYNAEIIEPAFIQYIRDIEIKQNRKIEKIPQSLIEAYMKDRRDINTKIDLTDVNINKAFEEFKLILNSTDVKDIIKCSNVEQSWNSRIVGSRDMDTD